MENGNQPISVLTNREQFAGMAMQAILGGSSENDITAAFVLKEIGLETSTTYSFKEHYPRYIAKLSVRFSDALLAELSTNNLTKKSNE